tara:strand:+ start:774 stop:947 length:174 start_codon:yes stop_codon:yes gene_type:complete
MVIAARMAMTTITMRSSTIVKPEEVCRLTGTPNLLERERERELYFFEIYILICLLQW